MGAQPTPKPKAYSYVRFSTPEQLEGHSLKRQLETSQQYAAAHGLELVEGYEDLGLSAFKGQNISAGALGTFLEAIRNGEIERNSYLLVESLDRISRQSPRKAARALEDICELGVTVVDIADGGRRYSSEILDADPFAFLMLVLKFIRANEESVIKQQRVSDAFERKRRQAREGEPVCFTRQLPAWLSWDDEEKRYSLIETRATIVRDIFQKARDGWGQQRIAQSLNERKVATWGAGKRKADLWHTSYVRKILTNPATIGTFTPRRVTNDGVRRVRQPLDPIEGFWPAAVEGSVFEAVNSRLETTGARGRNANNAPKFIFAGLLKCVHCGCTVTRVSKAPHVYLVCTKAHGKAGCKYQSVPYGQTEQRVIANAEMLIEEAPRGECSEEFEAELAGMEEARDALILRAFRCEVRPAALG
jgi:DNA invertase Pin-like site-specific DNA recombinase